MTEKQTVTFRGRVIRCVYNSEDFKIYAMDVDKTKYNVKFSKYGNAIVKGNIHILGDGQEYEVTAVEQHDSKGYSYKIVNIKKDKPANEYDMALFLSEILTESQARELYRVHPNVVDLVMSGKADNIDLSDVKGIKEKTFAKIKEKIIENYVLVELVTEFQGLLTLPMLKKLYNFYGSTEKIRIELKKSPYKALCLLNGVGFKTADALLLDMERQSKENIKNGKPPIVEFDLDLKTSKQRCLACVHYLLEENQNNGHTKMDIIELKNQCDKLVPACAHHFVECMKDNSVYYDISKKEVGIKSTYEVEKYIGNRILEGLERKDIWNYDIEKYKKVNGVELSDEQLNALDKICKNQIILLNGHAGCVDCDTEFFTGTEWKKISKYQEGDQVLQYNKDGTAELVIPEDYIKQKADYLWHFKTRYGLNQCLSLKHNCCYTSLYATRQQKQQLYFKTLEEIKDMQEKGNGFRGRFLTTFKRYGNGIKLNEYQIRLAVAIIGDGCFRTDGRYHNCLINLKKERKKKRLEWLLEKNNIQYSRYNKGDGFIEYKFSYTYLNSKIFPNSWYDSTEKQFETIYDELFHWDGLSTDRCAYYSIEKKNIDFVQYVGAVLGYKSSVCCEDIEVRKSYIDNREIKKNSPTYRVWFSKTNTHGLNCDNRTPDKWTKFSKYKTIDGYEYCFTVPSHMLVLRRNNSIFITGNCGKSFSTKSFINMFKDNNKSFILLSPTGKAAKILSEYTGEPASTIHRGLGYMPPNIWRINQENKLNCDVVIIDEFSMCDVFLFKRVLDAIDFTKTKLMLIGDSGQLPSVSCGNLLYDLMRSNIVPTTTLSKVFRYSEGGLMAVATDVRNQKTYLKDVPSGGVELYGHNKDYAFINVGSNVLIKNLLALYKKLLAQGYTPDDIQVLTAYNKGDYGSVAINNHIQKVANKNCGDGDRSIKCGDTIYYQDDIVIQKVNNYDAKVYVDASFAFEEEDNISETFIANGETGRIVEVNWSSVVIDFDGAKVLYNRDDLQGIGLGYSMSIHKSQGSSSRVVILLTPQNHIFMLNSNLIYVGLTRMKEKCYHFGNPNTVNTAIKKKENFNRQTFLQDILKGV